MAPQGAKLAHRLDKRQTQTLVCTFPDGYVPAYVLQSLSLLGFLPMATAKPFVMGIGGGSGSGKSTIVKEILKQLGTEKVSVIQHDSYYKNRPELSFEKRTKINFDHPDSLETNLLVEHLNLLISGKNVEIPVFHHFTKYLRDSSTKKVESRPILIVEGILVLNNKELRDLMNLKVFIDVPPDLKVHQTVKTRFI